MFSATLLLILSISLSEPPDKLTGEFGSLWMRSGTVSEAQTVHPERDIEEFEQYVVSAAGDKADGCIPWPVYIDHMAADVPTISSLQELLREKNEFVWGEVIAVHAGFFRNREYFPLVEVVTRGTPETASRSLFLLYPTTRSIYEGKKICRTDPRFQREIRVGDSVAAFLRSPSLAMESEVYYVNPQDVFFLDGRGRLEPNALTPRGLTLDQLIELVRSERHLPGMMR